jgi:hypothetical protein
MRQRAYCELGAQSPRSPRSPRAGRPGVAEVRDAETVLGARPRRGETTSQTREVGALAGNHEHRRLTGRARWTRGRCSRSSGTVVALLFALPFTPWAPKRLGGSLRQTETEKRAISSGFLSAPGEIRTPDLRFRRPTLYPAELRALIDFLPANPVLPVTTPPLAPMPLAGQKPTNTGEYVPANRARAQNRSGRLRARITPASSRVREPGGTRNRI